MFLAFTFCVKVIISFCSYTAGIAFGVAVLCRDLLSDSLFPVSSRSYFLPLLLPKVFKLAIELLQVLTETSTERGLLCALNYKVS